MVAWLSDALSSIPCMHVCASVFHGLLLRIARIPPLESWTTCPSRPYFCFSVLFFPPPFLPDLDALLPPADSVATLSLFLFLCIFRKAIQYRPSVSRTLIRLSKPKSSLPGDWADPSSRRGERNGLYSCLSCNTAPDCFGKLQVAGTWSNVRLTSQLLTCVA